MATWQDAKAAYALAHGYEEPPTDAEVFWAMLGAGLLDSAIDWPLPAAPPEEETE